jgi:hypothetical protein
MSALSGAATALAVAIALTVYVHSGYRTERDIIKNGFATVIALGLFAFVAYDMRHAAMAYLGINASKLAVEFEIRCRDRRGRPSPRPRWNYTPTGTRPWRVWKGQTTSMTAAAF